MCIRDSLECDLGLGRHHAVDPIELTCDHLGDLIVGADAHHRDEIEVAGYRVDLADAVDGGNLLPNLPDSSHFCLDEYDRRYHAVSLTPPARTWPDAALTRAMPGPWCLPRAADDA